MKIFKCDQCGKENYSSLRSGEAPVVVKGVGGTQGGILMPEATLEKHFCCTACFWAWVEKFNPHD
jgi:hypothetical protein